jgi:hypothetical protein
VRAGQELLKEEMLARSDAHHKRMKMETMNLEVNPEEIKSKTEQEEVSKEEAALETFGALKEWYGNWHLAVRRHS